MTNHGVCLAAIQEFGQIYDCGSCGNIHVQVGPVNITLEPKAYMQLVAMISTSAANFESWMQHKSENAPDKSTCNQKGIQ